MLRDGLGVRGASSGDTANLWECRVGVPTAFFLPPSWRGRRAARYNSGKSTSEGAPIPVIEVLVQGHAVEHNSFRDHWSFHGNSQSFLI